MTFYWIQDHVSQKNSISLETRKYQPFQLTHETSHPQILPKCSTDIHQQPKPTLKIPTVTPSGL